MAGCQPRAGDGAAADAGVEPIDSGIAPVDVGTLPSDARPGDDAVAPRAGGHTLWIGNSLVRHGASGPYTAYDVAAVVQDLQATSGVGARQVMHVLAQDGFDLFGWWSSWYGYTRDGEIISAARAIVEDGAAARTYDPALEYTPLAPGEQWARIILLGTAYDFVESPEHWYGSFESGASVATMERWFELIRSVDPAIEILHYEGVVDSRIMEHQPDVDRLYDEIQARWGGRIVPVGRAFAAAVGARPGLDLRRTRDNDHMHFSDSGVYLAACVFFAVLYGDPRELPVTSDLDVSAADAPFLQRTAQDAVTAVGSGPR